jgi:serine phosphatase RsbU (regulator of sigma subunit)/ketosteroid isomerase-like protein
MTHEPREAKTDAESAKPMTRAAIEDMFNRRQKAFDNLDAGTLAADYTDDCTVESPHAGTHVGRAAVEGVLRNWFATFPDMKMPTTDLIIDTNTNRVAQVVDCVATDLGGFLGVGPTGRPFHEPAVFVFEFRDQQIVRERRIYDVHRVLLRFAGEAEPPTELSRVYRKVLLQAQQEHELKIAAQIQRALLPQSRYGGVGFEIAARSVPCRAIGGDFFDYFNVADGPFAFALGDVAGKGPPAALLAALLQGMFAANAHRISMPAEILREANDALLRRTIESRFATAVYAMLSLDGQLTYCNAGHNPPFLIGTNGVRRLESGGPIVGALEQATFGEETIQLEPNDVIVAFSDGITEALSASGEEFGEERLLSCVRVNCELTPAELVECLIDTVQQFSIGAGQSDDLTVLALRYSGAQALAA